MSKLFSLLVAFVVTMTMFGVEAQAQTPLQLKANGFVSGKSKDVVFTPGQNVAFSDIFVGQDVSFPIRKKGEGPQLAPTRVFVGEAEVNPASAGVFVTPSPYAQHLRVFWVPALMPEDVQGPGFGRADLEGFYGEDGGYNAQFYVPRYNGFYVRYPLAAFATPEIRTTVMASEFWTKFVAARDKAKAEFEKKAKDEKKDDEKEEEKKDDEKEEGDKPEADKPSDEPEAPAAEEPKTE